MSFEMATSEHQKVHEVSAMLCRELMKLRVNFPDHGEIFHSIDHAIASAFDPQNHTEIRTRLSKLEDLMDILVKMKTIGVDCTGLKAPPLDIHAPVKSETLSDAIDRIADLVGMRGFMKELVIPTGGVDSAIIDALGELSTYTW